MLIYFFFFFFFNDTATTEIYTLSLHDALPISPCLLLRTALTANHEAKNSAPKIAAFFRSEEHTSELQSRFDLVCRLLLEKKNMNWCCRFVVLIVVSGTFD